MEARLRELFDAWDALQGWPEQDAAVRARKDAILTEMREILSNRTYLRNIVNDLVTTLG